jgi:hypothetical protein
MHLLKMAYFASQKDGLVAKNYDGMGIIAKNFALIY